AIGLDDPRPVPLAMIGLAGSAAALTIAEWSSRRRPGRLPAVAPARACDSGPDFGAYGSPGAPNATKTASRASAAGGLVAHLGVAVLLAGVAGTATGDHRTASLVPGQSVTVRGQTLRLEAVVPVPAPDGARAARATLTLERDGRHLATLRPVASVAASGDRVSEAALRSTPAGDLQVALRTVSGGGGAVVVEVFVVPLAQWIWWGALLVAVGIGLSMRRRPAAAPAPTPRPIPEPVTLSARGGC
ncbi:MAG TPA: cytochrome c-type biogenesis CcmF C-terminal domain-containing protein, partial [Acidimicrobiales bacterium]|nr:cytochrome c-type biogenesis CcmF C-terminal domain-containing protein [Acidimicrobiales bacterium]